MIDFDHGSPYFRPGRRSAMTRKPIHNYSLSVVAGRAYLEFRFAKRKQQSVYRTARRLGQLETAGRADRLEVSMTGEAKEWCMDFATWATKEQALKELIEIVLEINEMLDEILR
jgi:hypothetical protein